MNIFKWAEVCPETKNKILKRAEVDITEQMEIAKDVIAEVKEIGDSAVFKYTEKFDKALLTKETLKVTQEEIEQGFKNVEPEFRETLEFAANNIRKFHEKQMPESLWFTETVKGVMVGEQTNPISDVCIYVPRGKGSFPSVLLMLAIPAIVANVPKITVITPPNPEGNLDDAVLAAAKIAGVTEIYKVGGIQGVAAVAYGTETIPKCSKIIGPGNSFVTAAKRLLSGIIDIGSPAGPSEAIILSDGSVDPKKVALDFMIEAEHGPDSASLLVTHDEKLAEDVTKIVITQLEKLSPKRREFVQRSINNYGGIILTNSLEESIDFVNEYAPEHMEVMTKNPFDILPQIKNAGEILLGENAPISLANFVLGPNAILPTGAKAKTYSSVSVFDFLKRTSVGYVTEEGFDTVRDKVSIFARKEGFETHALAVEER
ncbi:histidinol dehydrogenase [Desulfonispora thiosulfatigenes DSM 11270]|uniref:histidinol dehydrogenase n=1 Tax=Desulfonispora thiosulfatigenes DSM 11270 TaxID=656914 RepID=A0A1W1V3Z0_DESTI|nr:histidinol dehydrogenase [Desulfonispora thiosulfatigenes]SMB88109.1 histidinol dehydrogenase [Desulfonispora thiosulfatigenes DSM 11270]